MATWKIVLIAIVLAVVTIVPAAFAAAYIGGHPSYWHTGIYGLCMLAIVWQVGRRDRTR